jgi:hypothetical protein
MESFLGRKKHFQYSLSLWQIGSIAGLFFLLPYIAWEVYWYCKVGMAAIKLHTYLVGAVVLVWLILMPGGLSGFIRKNMLLGLAYILLCLLIGEVHPFTRVPMYNKFDDYAYSFKLTDSDDQLIPISKYYRISSAGLGHKYSLFMQNPEALAYSGRELLNQLQESRKAKPPADSLRLYLVRHYLTNDSLLQTETLMYADKAWQ